MRPKLYYELFYKLLKLFFRGSQVTCLTQIHRSIILFWSQNALKMVIPISIKRFEYPVKTLMRPKLEDERFHKFLKLFLRDFQVTCISQIHRSIIFFFEPQCSKDGNSNIQLDI